MISIGDKFGKLTAIATRPIVSSGKNRIQVDLQCECGNVRTMLSNNIRSSGVMSCGCDKHNPADNIGKKFNKLTILELYHSKDNRGQKVLYAKCECECGTHKDIRYDRVRSGGTKSCGCIDIRRSTLGMNKERPYKIWYGMVRSCYSTKDHRYNRRGDKGIKVQDNRRYFTGWREDNKQYYSEERYFTRIDPFKDFTKDNCKRDVCYNVSNLDLFNTPH